MRIALALFVLTLMASCVAPPAPPLAPPRARAPAGRPAPARSPASLPADWRDWPLTPGDWTYAANPAGSRATLASGAGALLAVRCDRAARRISVIRFAPNASTSAITARTSTASRAIPVTASGSADAVEARLAATDPLLDAIAFSRGRWTIEQSGTPPLVLPAYAEVARVIEDCRG